MRRSMLLILLSMSLVFGCLAGCGTKAPAAETTTPNQTELPNATESAEPSQPTEPDDGSLKLYYDDRLPVSQLGSGEVEIKSQEPTSTQVGTDTTDLAVLYYDQANAQFIAVGVGTATVSVGGTEQLIRVRPAPISLVMITGHSIGAGQEGNAAQSIVCTPGQAYSSHKTETFQTATANMGIGYAAAEKPQGIDAFAPGGGGTIGEGSGIAYRWNQLTGEKIWVLNAGVGGSVIPEWQPGQKNYDASVAMYRSAAQVLANEVKAGHYILRNTAIIYHSAANFSYKSVEFTDETMEYWYDKMISGFKADLSMDISGDGKPETVQSIGFLPLWSAENKNSYFSLDRPINYYLAASDAFDGCFMAGETMKNWTTPEDISANFPPVDYPTQSQPVTAPETMNDLLVADGVHYTQVGYNAAGLELGENLYKYFRTKVTAESVTVLSSGNIIVKDKFTFRKKGATESFVIVTQPCYASDFTIEVSDNLELSSPFKVKAKAAGEGKITISKDGEVIKEIKITVKD